jgi:hypothetical protein
VAAVFVNRLRQGMRLQTDPTVIYGLGENFDGNLRKSDLLADTPYNTYLRPGSAADPDRDARPCVAAGGIASGAQRCPCISSPGAMAAASFRVRWPNITRPLRVTREAGNLESG